MAASKGPNRAPDQRAHRLLTRAAEHAHRAEQIVERQRLDTLDQMSMMLRVMRDSAEEYRRVITEMRRIADSTTVSQARRIARRCLESIA